MYLLIKHAHIIFVMLSISGFIARSLFCFIKGKGTLPKWARILPHINDTLLLSCGVYLAFLLRLNPIEMHWFGLKLICLLFYIFLGGLTFRYTNSITGKVSFSLALLSLGMIIYLVRVKPVFI
jgi:uncharacterized membrane protein SirB2